MPSLADRILQPDYSNLEFSFSPFLKSQFAFGLDSNRPVCRLYVQGHCPLGNSCPDKHHTSQDRTNTRQNTIVCKHWLKALCKKGDACEFLHEYNLRRMPECYFYAKHGFCTSGEECLYRHIDPDSRQGVCPWYEMGFCPLGPDCRQKHVRKTICQLYLTGFCPRGKECEESHPKHISPPFPPQKRGTGVSDTFWFMSSNDPLANIQAIFTSVSSCIETFSDHVSQSITNFSDHVRLLQWSEITWDNIKSMELLRPIQQSPPPDPSLLERMGTWVKENKYIIVTLLSGGAIATGIYVYNIRKPLKIRRAKRASNGSRSQVVAFVGSPRDRISQSTIIDLEAKGFIVLCIVSSSQDEVVVGNLGKPDIRAVLFDAYESSSATELVQKIDSFLETPSPVCRYRLIGLVICPAVGHPTGPLESISSEYLADAVHTDVVGNLIILKAFLPTLRKNSSKVVLMTLQIIPSLNPPFHVPQILTCSALSSAFVSLSRELTVPVRHVRIGAVDQINMNFVRADVLSWSPVCKSLYGQTYSHLNLPTRHPPSSIAQVHDAVFDALTSSRHRRVWNAGSGVALYQAFGALVPESIIGQVIGCTGQKHALKDDEDWERIEK